MSYYNQKDKWIKSHKKKIEKAKLRKKIIDLEKINKINEISYSILLKEQRERQIKINREKLNIFKKLFVKIVCPHCISQVRYIGKYEYEIRTKCTSIIQKHWRRYISNKKSMAISVIQRYTKKYKNRITNRAKRHQADLLYTLMSMTRLDLVGFLILKFRRFCKIFMLILDIMVQKWIKNYIVCKLTRIKIISKIIQEHLKSEAMKLRKSSKYLKIPYHSRPKIVLPSLSLIKEFVNIFYNQQYELFYNQFRVFRIEHQVKL